MRVMLLAVLFAALATGCAAENPEPQEPARPATAQAKRLDWVETFGGRSAQMTFRVHSFRVLAGGWRARISITNDTPIGYTVADPDATVDRRFGVMLFRTGDLEEVERRNSSGELPSTRRADEFRPPLPLVLEPGATYSGTMGAGGSLAAERWVRIVFGALVPVGDPPADFPEVLVWITDHAYRLR